MKLDRNIFLNPVEPEFLAFRLSSGIETKIDFHFKAQNGAPHAEDVVAQLQMTSRSQDQTEYLSVPAIDVINGIARATIPAGLAYDPNGWRLRLTGTVNQEPRVIAYGVATAVAGAGPQVEAQDVIDTINLTLARNLDAEFDVDLWQDAGKSIPYDLTSTVIAAGVYSQAGGTPLVPFTTTVIDNNTVKLTMAAEQVNTLPDNCWWYLTATTGGGLTTLAEGSVTMTGAIIPPLVETILTYDYQKPATDVAPTTGQLVQCNVTQNVLKVAAADSGAVDQSATLVTVKIGDEILLGATIWTVTATALAAGWFEYTVTPVVQDVASGVTAVTFRRP